MLEILQRLGTLAQHHQEFATLEPPLFVRRVHVQRRRQIRESVDVFPLTQIRTEPLVEIPLVRRLQCNELRQQRNGLHREEESTIK